MQSILYLAPPKTNAIPPPGAHLGGERLDGRAALGAAVEREVDPGLGPRQGESEPGVGLGELRTQRADALLVGAEHAVLDVLQGEGTAAQHVGCVVEEL